MLFTIISSVLIIITLHGAYRDFRKDSSLIKNVYMSRPIDYMWAFLILSLVSILIVSLSSVNLPNFLTWSWINLLSDTQDSGNVITLAFTSRSIIFISLFWIILSMSLPYLAKAEEESFRSGVFGLKNRILKNIIFGLVHMIMGVPLYISLIIGLCGFIFSIFYTKTFNKNSHLGFDYADKIATSVATSVHAKYNLIIITIAAMVSILLTFYQQ